MIEFLGFQFRHLLDRNSLENAALISCAQYLSSLNESLRGYLKRDSDFNAAIQEISKLYSSHSPCGKEREESPSLTVSEEFRDAVTNFMGDFFFNCHAAQFADWLTTTFHNVFLYQFKQRSVKALLDQNF